MLTLGRSAGMPDACGAVIEPCRQGALRAVSLAIFRLFHAGLIYDDSAPLAVRLRLHRHSPRNTQNSLRQDGNHHLEIRLRRRAAPMRLRSGAKSGIRRWPRSPPPCECQPTAREWLSNGVGRAQERELSRMTPRFCSLHTICRTTTTNIGTSACSARATAPLGLLCEATCPPEASVCRRFRRRLVDRAFAKASASD